MHTKAVHCDPYSPSDLSVFHRLLARLPYLKIYRKTSIPIAGGECEYLTHGFKALLDAESVDFVQPDVAASGKVKNIFFCNLLKV